MELIHFLTFAVRYSGLKFIMENERHMNHVLKVHVGDEFITFPECQKFCKEDIGGRLPFAEDHTLIVSSFAETNYSEVFEAFGALQIGENGLPSHFEYFVGAEFNFDRYEWVWMDTEIKVPQILWLEREYSDTHDNHFPKVNDRLVKNGIRHYTLNRSEQYPQIKIENGVPMMTNNYRADYYCEDNKTIGYNATFEQANNHCGDLGLEIAFFPDMVKEDLPQEFIDRLDHVDDRGLIGSIQLWTGARRNTATSFIYKGQVYEDEELGLFEASCTFMSASIGNEYKPNEIEEYRFLVEKDHDMNKVQALQRNRPPIGQFYMECVQDL